MRPVMPTVDSLEGRRLLAAVEPTAFEQYMIEMVNRARANPVAEAQRYGIDLNEGLAPGTLSTAARQPLALNLFATDAVRSHVNWLRSAGQFSHTGSGGSNVGQRLTAAGYTNSTGWSENLAVNMSSWSSVDLRARMETQHRNLFVDQTIPGRGHRLNMLGAGHREIGSGVSSGSFTFNGTNWASGVLSGQKFASRAGNPFLTGVAYTDAVQANSFYTPGEGLAGITITAVNSAGRTYSTTTYNAGGYSLQLPAGTYQVSASGNGLGVVRIGAVTVGSENVKRDFTPGMAQAQQPEPLVVNGTTGNDTINISISGSELVMTVNGTTTRRALDLVSSLTVNGLEGNDSITLAGDVVPATVNGGAGDDSITGPNNASRLNGDAGHDYVLGGSGNDSIYGGTDNDTLTGAAGRDIIHGEDGNDRINGGHHDDAIYGGAGEDRLYGNGGNDVLDGGGHVDRIWAGDGDDMLIGGGGNDRLLGEVGNDTLVGNAGTDFYVGGSGTDRVLDRTTGELIDSIETVG